MVKCGEGGNEPRVRDVHSASSASRVPTNLTTAEPEGKDCPWPPGRGVGGAVRANASRTDDGVGVGNIFWLWG